MFDGLVKRFLYWPERIERDCPLPAYISGAREIWFNADDGNEIHSLYWPAAKDRPTILFFHGNAQTVFEWALIRHELQVMDCGLLLVDYPGYGKSSGKPSEESLYSCGHAAFKWLTGEGGLASEEIVIFGKSLGGGVTCEVARGKKLKGVVLESTFTSIPAVAKKLLPMLPINFIFKSERYESINKLPEISAPVLVVHGKRDDLIPLREGEALYEKANEPKELYLVGGAGHNDVAMVAGDEYGFRLRNWLDSLIP